MRTRAVNSATGAVVAALFVTITTTVTLASFQHVLIAMQTDHGLSTDQANTLAFTPAAASLVGVFLVGALADRWGPRRPLIVAISLFLAGTVLVVLAPDASWVIVGRILDGVGGVTMVIIGLSVINSTVTDAGKRARVFGIYAAITPAAFMVAPLIAGVLVDVGGWRAGMLPGMLLAVASLVLSLRFVPSEGNRRQHEMLTALFAGVALAGTGLAITALPTNRTLATVAAAVAVVGTVLLVIALLRLATPGLDLRWTRARGVLILLIAVGVSAMPNIFFYTNLLLQYRYQVPLTTLAVWMIVPQACALAGALLSGPVTARVDPARATVVALVIAAIASLSTLLVTASAPIWVPVLALAVSATPAAFIVGPMTNALLSSAPPGSSGSASSARAATRTLGNVVGGAFIGTAAFSAFQSRLTDNLVRDGLTSETARTIAEEIRGGAVVDELALRISEPIARESLIAGGRGLLDAQSHAFAVVGIVNASMFMLAALLLVMYLRRRSNTPTGVMPGASG